MFKKTWDKVKDWITFFFQNQSLFSYLVKNTQSVSLQAQPGFQFKILLLIKIFHWNVLAEYLCFVWNIPTSSKELKMNYNSVIDTKYIGVCTVSYNLNYGTSSSVLFGHEWEIFQALFMLSSHFRESRVNMLKISYNSFIILRKNIFQLEVKHPVYLIE